MTGNGKVDYKSLHFTPTQRRMLDVLRDGKPHTRAELKACLDDDLSSDAAVADHITDIRRKIRPAGFDIAYLTGRPGNCYQAMKLLDGDLL